MNTILSRIACATAAVAVGGFLAAGAARADVISIDIGLNGGMAVNEATGGGFATDVQAIDGYNLNIVAGVGNPPLPFDDELYSNALDVSSRGTSNVLDVYVSDQNIKSPTGMVDFLSSFTQNSLTSGWTVTQSTWLNPLNHKPSFFSGGLAGFESHSIELGSVTFNTASVGGTLNPFTADTGAGPYSLTEIYVITPNGKSGASNATIDISVVPEPGTLALLGAGLLGCALFVGRRRHASQPRV